MHMLDALHTTTCCAQVVQKVSINIVRSAAELEAEVARLEAELESLRRLCNMLEAQLRAIGACDCPCHKQ